MELVVVVSILSLLLIFSVPLFRDISEYSNRRPGISGLVNLIQSLKQKAVRLDKDFFLFLDTGSGLVWTVDETMDDSARETARENGIVFDEDVSILSVEFFDIQGTAESGNSLRFSKNGYSDRALVHLRENDDDVTLKISTFLPRVEIFRRYVSYDDCT